MNEQYITSSRAMEGEVTLRTPPFWPAQVSPASGDRPLPRYSVQRLFGWAFFVPCLLLSLVSCRLFSQDTSTRLPDIVLIVADDMGQEIGCYGDTIARTPHLDQFAWDNLRFVNAYVTQASCSPSRSSILTGLYPHQNGQTGLSHRGISMDRAFPNVASYLKERGYRTGILGKLHVAPQSAFPFDYKMGGFDYTSSGLSGYGVSDREVEVLTTEQEVLEQRVTFSQRVDLMADSAAAFMERSGDQPFFLMANFLDPHTPWFNQVGEYPGEPFDTTEVQQLPYFGTPVRKTSLAGYYNGCARMDAGFDILIRQLKAAGRYDNTLIIFIGDHGAPLPRAKTTVYEAGLRIPMLIKYPGQQHAQEDTHFVSTIDLLPTILQEVGIEIPSHLPGRPLQVLQADSTADWRTSIQGEFTQHVPTHLFPQRSITTEQYKLIISPFAPLYRALVPRNFDDQRGYIPGDDRGNAQRRYRRYANQAEVELYFLPTDPHEFENLAEFPEYQTIRKELVEQLHQWQERTEDPLLSDSAYVAIQQEVEVLVESHFNDDTQPRNTN
ncbi:sulfatase family protein [Tunicatimonas pelagia]|uniref:sulfatase family protein n=1 Tax=Tunicatimonas pelagia TaxID=931531 RepID=UPI0026668725|nr:sulfatase [Tunicatimonas pelagia]WKN44876.1 sulfatase [Tunicatimonas pelagia]